MSERHDRTNVVETHGRVDDMIVVVVVAGLTLIGAVLLLGDHTGGTLVNPGIPKVGAPAAQ